MAEGAEKPFDLEERTFIFARDVRSLIKQLPRTVANIEDARQLIRCSGSIGANYIEGNDALSKKDFRLRLKIARREAKESRFFLRLLDTGSDPATERFRKGLVEEALALVKILSAILRDTTDPHV